MASRRSSASFCGTSAAIFFGVFGMPHPSDRYRDFHEIFDLRHDLELAAELGNMIVSWSYAEAALADTMSYATGMTSSLTLDLMSAAPTFDSKLRMTRTIVSRHVSSEAVRTKIIRELDALSRLAKTRNDFVHGSWAKSPDSKVTVTFDRRQEAGKPGRRKHLKASDVLGHSSAVAERSAALRRIVQGLRK
jgi:hypothetical protein